MSSTDLDERERFTAGDHLRIAHTGWSHHGIYVGGGRVVEFSGEKTDKPAAAPRDVDLLEFEKNGRAEVVRHVTPPRLAPWAPTALPREECVERAKFLVRTAAPGRYNLFGHNCEHAATWCATGFPESHQVRVGLYANMLRSAGTLWIAAWWIRTRGGVPRWVLWTTAASWIFTAQYHWHQWRFVREIDRAWRAEHRT